MGKQASGNGKFLRFGFDSHRLPNVPENEKIKVGIVLQAKKIGEQGSNFIQKQVQMKYVYDYMFHLFSEYSKLLKYKPTVPPNATEVCSESLFCSGVGMKKRFKLQSLVESPSDTGPCNLPSPYDPPALQEFLRRNENLTRQVESWESSNDTGASNFISSN